MTRRSIAWDITGIVVIVAIIFAAKIAWAVVVHDDWRCAVADCRLVTP